MARTEIPFVVIDPATGNAVVGASLAVTARSTGLPSTIYAGEFGGTTVTNPRTTDAFGRVTGWLERGSYNLTISGGSLTTYVKAWDSSPAADASIDSPWLADGSVTSARILDATIVAADLASSVGSFGAWTAYTPTWGSGGTAPAIGNGTITGAYQKIGRTTRFRVLLTAGSTTTFGTSYYSFTVPVTAASGATGSYTPVGQSVALDFSSTLIYEASTILTNTTQVILRYQGAGGLVGATAPVTFAASDIIAINGTYEAAA